MTLSILIVKALTLFATTGASYDQCQFTEAHLRVHNVSSLKYNLQREVLGEVVAPWNDNYEKLRRIHNRACCQKPLLIIRPKSIQVRKSYLLEQIRA